MKGICQRLGATLGRPISWAIALGTVVAVALVAAIFDAEWRNGLKDFQISLGGLGALAAALAAYDGATAAVREARRKEDRDRDELRRRLIIQSRLDTYNLNMICREHATLWSRSPPSTNIDVLKGLSIMPRAPAIESAWENIVLFSGEIANELPKMVLHLMALTRTREACAVYTDPEKVDPNGIKQLVNALNSTADAAERLSVALTRYVEAN